MIAPDYNCFNTLLLLDIREVVFIVVIFDIFVMDYRFEGLEALVEAKLHSSVIEDFQPCVVVADRFSSVEEINLKAI
jgi:hypothetical protein